MNPFMWTRCLKARDQESEAQGFNSTFIALSFLALKIS